MPVHHQLLSAMAWQDEQHVIDTRAIYRSKFETVTGILEAVWPMQAPEAGFYLWPQTPINDMDFTVRLIEQANVKVLPGTFLSRDTDHGNPGRDRVRMALVAERSDCIEAAERIARYWPELGG